MVVVTSDHHANSTVGLCPPYIERVEGGTYESSRAQKWLWSHWLEFWDEVKVLKKRHKAQLYHVMNGDIIDDPRFSTTATISKHKQTIMDIAIAVLEPAPPLSDARFVVRGTEAHTGLGQSFEEMIARDIEAEEAEDGSRSAHFWPIIAGGVSFDCAHHPDTSGRFPHTMKLAALRQSHIIATRYNNSGDPVPDVAIRSHIHYFADSGLDTLPRTFYTWGWQLTTELGHKRGSSGAGVRPVGGLIFICKEGSYEIITRKWKKPRPRPWRRD